MTAVVYDAPEKFSIRSIPRPVPAVDEVLLKVEVAGICGTDVHLHHGEFGPSYPLTPGHEFAGRVVTAGRSVTGLDTGQLVAVDNTSQCGTCAECRRARPAFCRNLVARGVNAPGGFAEYVTVPAARCFPVGDLPAEAAVFAEPTACVVHGLDVLGLAPGSDVLLFGAGPTGLILTQLLARSGAGRVVIGAPSPAKLALAASGGADEVVRMERSDPAASTARVRELAPNGFDVVIDATGSVGVLSTTIDLVRTGGTVFVYGMTPEAARWPVPPYEVFRRELVIKGSFAQQFSFDRAVDLLRRRKVTTEQMITHRFPLERYAEALEAVSDSASVKTVIILG
ncbi:zinc-dependent alcohol dehydrogenase family protein [Streptomyces sp. MMS24-I2-30]|uniref:zinc-dependent alcohol dehydrogenase family protein n=1 Tax=Streptomyces sp. MMS24-I2-30 TaxID=3351564 RepID=UPI003896E9B5